MRSTLDLPDDLLEEAMRLSGAKTKSMTIVMGLQELIHRKRMEELRRLRGTIELDLDIARARGRGKR